MSIPTSQYAIQFVGVDEIVLNRDKPVPAVGPTQLLLAVEVCGICFSDTKLLHAFDAHPRKSAVVSGLDAAELASVSSYVPGSLPAVPGHEPVCRVVAVGDAVTHYRVGDRVLVQADWRHLPTATSNGAFGYNFEGALQEYVLVDERIVVHGSDEFLIRVSEGPSAAQVGLIEPWATVEASYASAERRGRLPGGRLLVVADPGAAVCSLAGGPAASEVVVVGTTGAEVGLTATASELDAVGGSFDDIVYFGHDAATVEALGRLLGNRGVCNVVLGGGRLERAVSIDAGRVHYDFIRFVGTPGHDPADGYAMIPETTDLEAGESLLIIGAAGPMGLMHTMRAAVLGRGVRIDAGDVSDERLANLEAVVAPAAAARGASLRCLNTAAGLPGSGYDYVTCMVPVPALLAAGVDAAGVGGVVNVFAGLPAGTLAELDLQAMIERRVFVFGTSGSGLSDMTTVLAKIEAGDYDTSISLDAVCGMAGVEEAIAAVNSRTTGGKILVYPSLRELGLVRVRDLAERFPDVARELDGGVWTKRAEEALLRG